VFTVTPTMIVIGGTWCKDLGEGWHSWQQCHYFWDRFVVQDHAKHVEPFCVELWWKSHCRKEVMTHTEKKICCRIKILSHN